MELTKCQTKSLQDLKEWWKSDQKTATLIGSAGTGKTTMVKQFLDDINVPATVTAPTHVAKFVFAQKTGRPSDTLQRMLGFQPNYNIEKFDINKAKFEATGKVKINSPILPCDEASMINKDMNEYLKVIGTDFDFKILYIGDKRQLPPIGEKKSSVFTNVDFTTELRTIVRQSTVNSLTVMLLALRIDIACMENDLEDERESILYLKQLCDDGVLKCSFDLVQKNYGKLFKFLLINKLLGFQDGKGVELIRNPKEFNSKMLQEFKSEDSVKTLAYYNETVDVWNNFIRNGINPSDDFIAENDILTGYKNNGLIFNGCDYKVDNTEKTEVENIPVYKVNLTNLLTGKKVVTNIIRYTEDDELYRFQKTHEAYHKQARIAPISAKKEMWREYMDWVANFNLPYSINTENFVHEDLDIYHYNLPKKMIGRGYSITVHKCQGSTYDTVFIDGSDLIKTLQYGKVMFYKLLYVAASRPRNKCYIYFPK